MSLSAEAPKLNISAEEMLDLARNPEKYAGLLADLRAEQKRLDDKIALAGPAEQILSLRTDADKHFRAAEQANGAAQALWAKARDEAARFVATAQKKAADLTASAETEAKITKANAEKRNKEVEARELKAFERETVLGKRAALIEAHEEAARKAIEEAGAVKASYEDRHARLSALLKG